MTWAIAAPAADARVAQRPRTLPQRILMRLPGARWRWRAAWALAPVVHMAIFAAHMEASGRNPYGAALYVLSVPNVLVFAFAILHAIGGAERLAEEAQALHAQRHARAAGVEGAGALGALRGPVALAAALVLVFGVDAWGRAGTVPALLGAPVDFVVYLPIATLIWTYFAVLGSLGRLGKEQLADDAYDGDRSLGLRPVGRLAVRAFQVLFANVAPLLLVTVGYGLGLVVGLAFLLAATAHLFASSWGLHRAMQRAKAAQVARAAALYAQAFAPLRNSADVDTLRAQAALLGAAEALEKRAQAIQTWPFSDAILARIVVIASGVATSILVKIVLQALGM